MSVFVLKIIAIITMILDHSSFLKSGPSFTWMRAVGRIAFPIFAFLIAEGYVHTKDVKKYYIRLIIFSLVSQIPFYLFNKPYSMDIKLNVGFTLLFGLIAINIYDKVTKKCKKKEIDEKIFYYSMMTIVILLLALTASILKFDYGFFGVLLILTFYMFRKNKVLLNVAVVALLILKNSSSLLDGSFNCYSAIYLLCYIASLNFINLYNGKEGTKMKWLFYVVYPVHLLILSIVDMYV